MKFTPLLVAIALVVGGCSSSSPKTDPGAHDASGDGTGQDDATPEADGPERDAGNPPSDTGDPGVDAAPAKTTALEVTVGGVERTASRAQFGIDGQGAEQTFHIEAHEGGDPACPTASSPTPKRTIIIAGLPVSAVAGASYTKADGIAVTVLDFTGDQVEQNGGIAGAVAATVTVAAIAAGASVEIDVDAKLEAGDVVGRVYATYCESLSD